MVSISPRLRDSLEYEEPDETDPRFQWGFRSLTLDDNEFHHYDEFANERPMSASSDSSNARKLRRQKQHDKQFSALKSFEYRTRADGHVFRLVTIKPGFGDRPIECELLLDSAKAPKHHYKCLSYCWQTTERDAEIKCDGFRLAVTRNLWNAMRSIRRPTKSLTIWIDQICINQDDVEERAQQVSIMKHIFNHAKQTLVWLGEEADNSSNLCEYAKKMRSRDGMRSSLSRILTPRQLEKAIAKLVERPWFQRIWVIPEICLAPSVHIVIGSSSMTWENLIRLIRDVPTPQSSGFAKQIVLPGNTRQRIAILSQMISQQKESKPQTDVTQLLILAKSSQATDIRDLVYAFYGMTIVNTAPDYKRRVETLYIDIAHNYINNLEASYDGWRDLTDKQRTFHLMSILYSAGALHQQHELPSWVPDWSVPWQLAPIWCKSASNAVGLEQDDERESIRGRYRAGGNDRDDFEVTSADSERRLRLSAILVDDIALVGEDTESMSDVLTDEVTTDEDDHIPSAVNYMRVMYRTRGGLVGVATQGVRAGDVLAIILGGDVPFLLRRANTRARRYKGFHLLCETMVKSNTIMFGDHLRAEWTLAEDIQLI